MFGLFERIGEGLEMISLPISGAISSATCAVNNFATDVRTEAKCRQIDREAKRSSSSDDKKKVSIEELINLSSDGKIDTEEFRKIAEANVDDLRSALAEASPEELAKLGQSLSMLNEVEKFVCTMRSEIAKASSQNIPILQPETGAMSLREQARTQGGVTGKDIVENLQKVNQQDIQHANPQGINNPILNPTA